MKNILKINLQLFSDDGETENETKSETEIKPETETKPENETKSENATKPENKDDNVSHETLNKNFENINQSLKNINSNIKKLNKIDEPEEDNSINLSSVDGKKILVDNKNKKLSDYEIYKRTLNMIKTDKENGNKIPITPNFIDYMKKYVENHEKNVMSDSQFKKENIYEKVPLSEVIFN